MDRKRAEWLSMFQVSVTPDKPSLTRADSQAGAAALLAERLRDHPTLPADPANPDKAWHDVACGGRLPPVSCAFKGCCWHGGGRFEKSQLEEDPEHPWDQELRRHILKEHRVDIDTTAGSLVQGELLESLRWDLYKEALAVKERSSVPTVGPSIDRRGLEHVVQVYNDSTIRSLICFCCAQIKTDTGRCRSEIEFRSGRLLLTVLARTFWLNFSHSEFHNRFLT